MATEKIFSFGYDDDVQTWLNQITGGTDSLPTPAYISSLNTFITDLKNANIWSELDRIWIFATEQQQHAKISLINPTSTRITEVNSPTWTANQGYSGNSVNSYLNTNYTALTQGVKFTLNNASFGIYNRTSGTGPGCEMGVWNSLSVPGLRNLLDVKFTDNNTYMGVNANSSIAAGFTCVDELSLFVNVKTGATTNTNYNRGILRSTKSISSAAALNETSFFILGANTNNAFAQPSNRQISLAFIGSSNFDQLVFYNIIQRFAIRQGFNV